MKSDKSGDPLQSVMNPKDYVIYKDVTKGLQVKEDKMKIFDGPILGKPNADGVKQKHSDSKSKGSANNSAQKTPLVDHRDHERAESELQ